MKKQNRTLRIIGGKWRSRKVTFADGSGIRPTSDRIRETLFNWLREDIHDARCLELFAGSGALSMEALSRGARHVTLIESNATAVAHLERNLSALGADSNTFEICRGDAVTWLANCDDRYDLVFIDPPFDGQLIGPLLATLSSRQIASHWVYLETPLAVAAGDLPQRWSLHRQKQAGAVHYCLCEIG